MTEYKTISNTQPPHPGMDFDLLKKEGIKYIREMAGLTWTDHNTHDPGITILEHLCYAITDLSYRLSFDIEDILAYPKKTDHRQFFTAGEILPVNPVTINDFRKIVIDITGVKNCWLETIDNPDPALYYNPNKKKIGFTPTDSGSPVSIRGLYSVLIEKDQTNPLPDEVIKKNVLKNLHNHRNLCEDFYEIKILSSEIITPKAEIEIDENEDSDTLLARIIFAIDNYIAPSIRFYSLTDLLNQGKPVEKIFYGPRLSNGFIDDNELNTFQRKEELHVSDIIQAVFSCGGVINIRKLTISGAGSQEDEDWVLKLSMESSPAIAELDHIIEQKCFKLYKNNIPCHTNASKVKEELEILKQNIRPAIVEDITSIAGKYRNLSQFETIQNDFPSNYGIGEAVLPDSTSDLRKAQSKQLKGFLMFFDRVLADYFAQLDHTKNLFSFSNNPSETYSTGLPANMRGMSEIISVLSKKDSENLKEDTDEARIRKNRILDHLMAVFSESFTDYSLLMYYSGNSGYEELVKRKSDFLKSYPEISANRAKAINYRSIAGTGRKGNTSGLKNLISAKLGLSGPEKKFEIIEHILFRPVNSGEGYDKMTLHLNITNSKKESASDDIKDNTSLLHPDPFSFMITFVFPDWPARYRDENFRLFLYETLSAETPAHISFNVLWFNKEQLEEFNKTYNEWLKGFKKGKEGGGWAKAGGLMKILEIGNVKQAFLKKDFHRGDAESAK